MFSEPDEKSFVKANLYFNFFPLLHPDGQIVDVGLGQKMHLLCKGQGRPVGNKSYDDIL